MPSTIFNKKMEPTDFIGIQDNLKDRAMDYQFYPICKLDELINRMPQVTPGTTKLRYIVDLDFQIWFAFEGDPSTDIPGHGKMVDNAHCITAGDIELNRALDTLIGVNNKSSNFTPHVDSTKWFFAVVMVNYEQFPIKIAQEIIFERQHTTIDPFDIRIIDVKAMQDWVNTNVPKHLQLKMANQPDDVRTKYSLGPVVTNEKGNSIPSRRTRISGSSSCRRSLWDTFNQSPPNEKDGKLPISTSPKKRPLTETGNEAWTAPSAKRRLTFTLFDTVPETQEEESLDSQREDNTFS